LVTALTLPSCFTVTGQACASYNQAWFNPYPILFAVLVYFLVLIGLSVYGFRVKVAIKRKMCGVILTIALLPLVLGFFFSFGDLTALPLLMFGAVAAAQILFEPNASWSRTGRG